MVLLLHFLLMHVHGKILEEKNMISLYDLPNHSKQERIFHIWFPVFEAAYIILEIFLLFISPTCSLKGKDFVLTYLYVNIYFFHVFLLYVPVFLHLTGFCVLFSVVKTLLVCDACICKCRFSIIQGVLVINDQRHHSFMLSFKIKKENVLQLYNFK